MSIIDDFKAKKDADSAFISLGDGESVIVRELLDITVVNKAGFGGEMKEVLRLKCAVDTSQGVREKIFDNGTQKFAKELQENQINVGSSFTITRLGLQTKTTYKISKLNNAAGTATPASAVAATPAS